MPYPHSFADGIQPLAFRDPFDMSVASIPESGATLADSDLDDSSFDAALREAAAEAVAADAAAGTGDVPRQCGVCDASAARIAVLAPCAHPLCSACLTSALNIVGEKDMRCAVCSAPVDDFRLHTFGPALSDARPALVTSTPPAPKRTGLLPSAFDGKQASPEFSVPVPAAFGGLFDQVQDVSSPPRRVPSIIPNENIVLRIDNVPWVSLQSSRIIFMFTDDRGRTSRRR
jgi:hypothetical protein